MMWFRTPSGMLRGRKKDYVALISTGPNTFTGSGTYRHANIRPPLTSNALDHIVLHIYRTIRDLKADCEKVIDALAAKE